MTQEQAQKIAQELFPNYPDQDVFHITEDGQAFFNQNDATNHVKNIGGEIVEVKRTAGAETTAPELTEAETAKAGLEKEIAALEKKQQSISSKLTTLKDPAKVEKAHADLAEINKDLEAKRAQLAALVTE